MPILIAVLRYLHIFFGSVAFVCGPGALLTNKGGKAHQTWGKVFLALTASTFLSLILGLWRANYFLFLVGLFSFYLAFAGYRVLYRKRPDLGQQATAPDYAVTVICLAATVGMLVMSVVKPVFVRSGVDPVLSVFGLIGTLGTYWKDDWGIHCGADGIFRDNFALSSTNSGVVMADGCVCAGDCLGYSEI